MGIRISGDCKLLYADDSAILYLHRDLKTISLKPGSELETCSKWLIDNKLLLKLGKTECILLGSWWKLRSVNNFSIEGNGHTIKSKSSVKYIDLTLDNHLTNDTIASSVIQKVNSRLKYLYRQYVFLTQKTQKSLCSALIQCHFDYSCSSWFSRLNKTLKKEFQISQNKMVQYT